MVCLVQPCDTAKQNYSSSFFLQKTCLHSREKKLNNFRGKHELHISVISILLANKWTIYSPILTCARTNRPACLYYIMNRLGQASRGGLSPYPGESHYSPSGTTQICAISIKSKQPSPTPGCSGMGLESSTSATVLFSLYLFSVV